MDHPVRVLIAEDDAILARTLCQGLAQEHYAVDWASDGEEAKYLVCEFDYDLLILDLCLPRRDGLEVLQALRDRKKTLPVLILSGLGKVEDRIRLLDSGADDYLVKPCSIKELNARVRALLRRRGETPGIHLRYQDLELDRVQRIVTRNGRRIQLTSKEFALLEYLLRNAGRRVTRSMIIENVWNLSFDGLTNVVDVYINYLRKKIDRGSPAKLIHTIRGVGYQLGA
ncbi:MAG TPA: response regulator transcription factor [Terriglobales bacterium]|nr:response regulator transcription factor [Terriglobales bacterium]